MKKANIAIIALIIVTLTATATFAQSGQTVTAEIPFSFNVRGKNYSAGKYIIKRADDSSLTWTIGGSDLKVPVKILMANAIDSERGVQNTMTFRRYDDQYFLAAFTTGSYRINLPKTKSEKLLQKELKTQKKLAKVEIVTINANAD